MGKRILVLGGGGREHALVWRLARDRSVEELFAWPGNPGIASLAVIADIASGSGPEAIAGWAEQNRIDLVVVGPEKYLFDGVADKLLERGVPVFGPSRRAARLEESKSFAKKLMARCGVPTASHRVFTSVADAVRVVGDVSRLPVVIKADGPAAGKGVVVAETVGEALRAVKELFPLGGRVLVEDYLVGEEASVFALTDGRSCILLPAAHDHKRAWEGGLGPNTGGMGAVAPTPRVTAEMLVEVRRCIIEPVLRGLEEEGTPFVGALYAGLMMTAVGPYVLEFNARMGDPETQAVLPLLEGDLAEVLYLCATGSLASLASRFAAARFAEGPQGGEGGLDLQKGLWRTGDRAAATIVIASGGYPGPYQTGKRIFGLEEAEATGAIIFHAGTKSLADEEAQKGAGGDSDGGVGGVVTDGGRVLSVTAVAPDIEQALDRAYMAADLIRFDGRYFRRDIGRAKA